MNEARPAVRAAMLVASPLVGWVGLILLPEALPKSPGLAGLASTVLVFGAAGVAAFALGYLQPSLWHVLGLVFAAPMVINGAVFIYSNPSNLWPLALAGVVELLLLVLGISFIGRSLRLWRSRRTTQSG